MLDYSYEQYKQIHKIVNQSAGCINCYDYNFVDKVLSKFVAFANDKKIRIGYNTGLTKDDANYIGVYGLGDGTKNAKIQAIVSVFDKVVTPERFVKKEVDNTNKSDNKIETDQNWRTIDTVNAPLQFAQYKALAIALAVGIVGILLIKSK